jgi:hypothetical protein
MLENLICPQQNSQGMDGSGSAKPRSMHNWASLEGPNLKYNSPMREKDKVFFFFF